jgi:hypothetical protein
MADVLGMPLTKAKNWTVGRPFKLNASLMEAAGKGTRNLYSIEDVYLMGLAYEFSRAGMAANAIGKLVEVVRGAFPQGLGKIEGLTVWRPTGKLAYQVREGHEQPKGDVLLWHTLHVAELVACIDQKVESGGKRPKRKRRA